MYTAQNLISLANDVGFWNQTAEQARGVAPCSACRSVGLVVYGARLQWCQKCWPEAAPFVPDTQEKDWPARRRFQEISYGWKP